MKALPSILLSYSHGQCICMPKLKSPFGICIVWVYHRSRNSWRWYLLLQREASSSDPWGQLGTELQRCCLGIHQLISAHLNPGSSLSWKINSQAARVQRIFHLLLKCLLISIICFVCIMKNSNYVTIFRRDKEHYSRMAAVGSSS